VKVFGIETSCDETAAAVVEDGRRILSNVVASQADIHARYGGVVPEVASRKHLESIVPVLETALRQPAVILRTWMPSLSRMAPGCRARFWWG
jgi:N6-L-threonylcarbamoyladenine synthase